MRTRPRNFVYWENSSPCLVETAANRHYMHTAEVVASAKHHRLMRKWASVWGLPDLSTTVQFELSPRLKTSLAHCLPAQRLVRLNPVLLEPSNRNLLQEVLCHELAHIAMHELDGASHRPHGPEWKSLVRAAGFEPNTRLALKNPRPGESPRKSSKFEHRCPVCQAVRYSTRRVRSWRCEACHWDGLAGELVITKL